MKYIGQLSLPFVRFACLGVFVFRVVFGVMIYCLNWNLPKFKILAKEILASGQQLELRLQQASFWPWEYTLWLLDKKKSTPVAQAQYMG